jgi:hypothetical protein
MRDGTLFIRRWSWVSVFFGGYILPQAVGGYFRECVDKDQWALTGGDHQVPSKETSGRRLWTKSMLIHPGRWRVGSAKRVAECKLNSRGAIPAW